MNKYNMGYIRLNSTSRGLVLPRLDCKIKKNSMPSTTTLSSVPSLTRSLPALTQKEDLKKHPRQGPTGGGEKQVKMKRYIRLNSTSTKYHPASSETLIKTTGQSIHYLRGTPKPSYAKLYVIQFNARQRYAPKQRFQGKQDIKRNINT